MEPNQYRREQERPEEQRTCHFCQKVFSSRQTMLSHIKNMHADEVTLSSKGGLQARRLKINDIFLQRGELKCEKCEKTFVRLDHYKKHSDSCGLEEESTFLCTHCGKVFQKKQTRDLHERSHTGDKRFPCSFCDKKV